MLKIAGIDVFRGETQVLWDISLEVEPGERVAILGSNGAGKSSLMAAVSGVLPIKKGRVLFRGETLNGKKPHQVARMGIAMVPEGRRIYKEMTIKENLEMGAYPGENRNRLESRMEYMFELFPVLKDRISQAAGTMSGGEQQMLAIGRALMSQPELLLIDELSLGLAPRVTKEIYETLKTLGDDITILIVEQNVEMALKNSRRAYVVESGKVTRKGPSEELMTDRDIRRAYLGL